MRDDQIWADICRRLKMLNAELKIPARGPVKLMAKRAS
jgi:hypothetical protein